MAATTTVNAQLRLVARGLLDYLAGVDPSAIVLTGALLTLIQRRGVNRR
jgi:hypothetical protein